MRKPALFRYPVAECMSPRATFKRQRRSVERNANCSQLVPMQFTDTKSEARKQHVYRVIAVNTAGLKSEPSAQASVELR